MDLSRHDEVAAYALGALGPDDARRFEQHLEQCEECQVELSELRPVVAALPAAADPVAPPPALRQRIMAVVESEAVARRPEPVEAPSAWRRFVDGLRPLPVAAAACALVLAGLGIGVALNAGDEPRTYPAQVDVRGASAELVVEGGDTAELVVHGMRPPPDGRVYQVWVKHRGRGPAPTDALFTVGRDGNAHVDVPGSVEGVEAILVTDEPEGGSEQPTRAPVIVARRA
jgi:anti-sigma-K factor RskA